MHTQTHAPGVPGATIAAQKERNHSREATWKHVLLKKGFNIHESSVRSVISVSLCLSHSFYSTTPASVCGSLLLPFWQQHIRHEALDLCVSANIPVSPLGSLSYFSLLLPSVKLTDAGLASQRVCPLTSAFALPLSSSVLLLLLCAPMSPCFQATLLSLWVYHISIFCLFVCIWIIYAKCIFATYHGNMPTWDNGWLCTSCLRLHLYCAVMLHGNT